MSKNDIAMIKNAIVNMKKIWYNIITTNIYLQEVKNEKHKKSDSGSSTVSGVGFVMYCTYLRYEKCDNKSIRHINRLSCSAYEHCNKG